MVSVSKEISAGEPYSLMLRAVLAHEVYKVVT